MYMEKVVKTIFFIPCKETAVSTALKTTRLATKNNDSLITIRQSRSSVG